MVKGSDMEHRDMDLTRISWDVSPSYGYTMHNASNKKICIYFYELNVIMLHIAAKRDGGVGCKGKFYTNICLQKEATARTDNFSIKLQSIVLGYSLRIDHPCSLLVLR